MWWATKRCRRAVPWYVPDYPVQERNVERAKELLAEAGVERVPLELMVPNDPISVQVGEVIQSMAGEVGFDISIRATEFATAIDQQEQGNYDAFLIGWSGRIDPDGNIHQYQTCDGNLNETGYCDPEVDTLLNDARAESDTDARFQLYKDAALRYLPDRHNIYLYHTNLFFPHTTDLTDFQAYPDGIIRFQGGQAELKKVPSTERRVESGKSKQGVATPCSPPLENSA